MSETVAKCPFCGGQSEVRRAPLGIYVECSICDARGPVRDKSVSGEANAVSAWNAASTLATR